MILSRKIMSFCPNYAYQITNSENKIKILVNYLDKTKWRVAFWGAGKYGYNIFSFLPKAFLIIDFKSLEDLLYSYFTHLKLFT